MVDDQGKPVANVSVFGLTPSMQVTPRAQTLEDGSFVLPAPEPGPFLVSIECAEPEQVSTGERPDLHAPGARDVKLVLKNVARTSFLVLDAASGAPIERYGLAVAGGTGQGIHGGSDMQELPLRAHARGVVVTHARPGRHLVRVEAPGHAPLEAPVALDADKTGRQTLRLYRGGSVRGRAVNAGKPLANARVAICRAPTGTVWPEPDDVVEPDSWFFQDCRRDLDDFSGRLRGTAAGAGGAFRFDDLAPGTYEVALDAPGLGPRRVKQVRVEAGAPRELGDLELGAPAVLSVRVVPPPGARAEELQCALDGDWRGRKPFPAGGTLVFEGLGAGQHRVVLTGLHTLLAQDEKRDVRLAAGETREVVFQPKAPETCEVSVRIVSAGLPDAAQRVAADVVDEKGMQLGLSLAAAQEPGVFRGALPLRSTVAWRVVGKRGLQIASRPRERVPSEPSFEVEIRVQPGSLELELPESLVPPEAGTLEIQLQRGAEPTQHLRICTAGSRYLEYQAPTWSGPRCDLGWIEAGEYEVSVEARADEAARELMPPFHSKVAIVPGAKATLAVGK